MTITQSVYDIVSSHWYRSIRNEEMCCEQFFLSLSVHSCKLQYLSVKTANDEQELVFGIVILDIFLLT